MGTYHGDDLVLDDGGEGHEVRVEGEVDLFTEFMVSHMVSSNCDACTWRIDGRERVQVEQGVLTDDTSSAMEIVCCAFVMFTTF